MQLLVEVYPLIALYSLHLVTRQVYQGLDTHFYLAVD